MNALDEMKGGGVCEDCTNNTAGIVAISVGMLTSIAGLVHVFDLDLTTQIFIFLCQTC